MEGYKVERPSWMPKPTDWDELPMEQRAEMIRVGIRIGTAASFLYDE